MSAYIYPNVPQVFNKGDQVLIVFQNKVQEIDLLSLGIGKCRIECFDSSPSVHETWQQTIYAAGTTDLSELIFKGVTKIYAVVGASVNMNYCIQGQMIKIPQGHASYNEYERFGGSSMSSSTYYGRHERVGSGASTDLRTVYDPNKGIYDAASRNSVFISAAGMWPNDRSVPTSVAGEPSPNNAPNEIIKFSDRVIKEDVCRFNDHGYIIITALGDSYVLNESCSLEIKTSNGVKKIPLYDCKDSGDTESFQAKLPSGEKLRAIVSLLEQPPDNVCIKNTGKKYLVDKVTAEKTTAVPVGQVKFVNDNYFIVPPNVARVKITPYKSNGNNPNNISQESGSFYYDVIPGEIISSKFWMHETKYLSDTSYYVKFNDQTLLGEGCLGWSGHVGSAPAYAKIEYNKDINDIQEDTSMVRPYVFLNGDKAIYSSAGTSSYTLEPADGHTVFIPHKDMKITISIPSKGKNYSIDLKADDRVARFKTPERTFIAVYNIYRDAFADIRYEEEGDLAVKIDIIS